MSYQMHLTPRKRKVARFVSQVYGQIQQAFTDAAREEGMTQRKLAEKLGVDKSVLHRRLTGEANLTLRSIADLAWALDADLEFAVRRRKKNDPTRNHVSSYEDQAAHSAPLKNITVTTNSNDSRAPRAVAATNGARLVLSE